MIVVTSLPTSFHDELMAIMQASGPGQWTAARDQCNRLFEGCQRRLEARLWERMGFEAPDAGGGDRLTQIAAARFELARLRDPALDDKLRDLGRRRDRR